MSELDTSKRSGIFYGWWVVATCCFFMFLYVGLTIYSFSLFVKPIAMELGFGRGPLMLGFTAFFVVGGIVAPFIGRIIDKSGAKTVIALGGFTFGIVFIILSQMHTILVYFIAMILMGVGAALMGHVPASTVVAQWFNKKRGLAMGIMTAGFGLGGLVAAPIVGGWVIPNYGWRTAYVILAVIMWVCVIPLALLVIKTRPSDMGLYADGEEAPSMDPSAAAKDQKPEQAFTLKEAMSQVSFWLVGLGFFLFSVPQLGIMQNQVPYLTDIGFNVALAVGALGVVGLMSGVGKFVFGWLCDLVSPKLVVIIGFACQFVGVLIFLALTGESSMLSLYVYAVIFGLGAGCWIPILGVLIGKYFGLANYGAIFGAVALMQVVGAALGPFFGGAMFDLTGSYTKIFAIFAAISCASVIVVALLPKSKLNI